MLDMEKREFVKTMNFQIKIPNIIVKISNTYYAKLSHMAKNFFKNGHNKEND